MKKNVITIALILVSIILILVAVINIKFKVSKATLKENETYEQYLDETIYGTDVATLINRAINSNESNNVSKDEKGYYINNNENSITIDLVMITNEDDNGTTTYKMEAISKVGITKFIRNFNITEFKCTKKEYHSNTGYISYIELTQQSI